MASSAARSRARERIERTARARLDSATLRSAILGDLADAIDFDGYVWLLTDPATTVGAAPLADVPGLPMRELPALILAKYGTALNRWTALVGRAEATALLGSALEGEINPTSTWLTLLGRLGVGDVASTVFADPFGCWGFLDLWRARERGPFEPEDAEFLDRLAPTVTTGLRASQARTFVQPSMPQRDDAGPVVLTVDDDLRILSRTAASQGWLDALLPPVPGAHAVPASVYNVAAQLIAVEGGVDDHPASTRTHLGDGFWVTLRAARMPPGGIVVTIEEASSVERLDLFARAYALTSREAELLGVLASGGDTRAMARAMQLSMHTVQDHLKAVFAKTEAHDRITLFSRVMGTRGAP